MLGWNAHAVCIWVTWSGVSDERGLGSELVEQAAKSDNMVNKRGRMIREYHELAVV
jgi:hypothetical protein